MRGLRSELMSRFRVRFAGITALLLFLQFQGGTQGKLWRVCGRNQTGAAAGSAITPEAESPYRSHELPRCQLVGISEQILERTRWQRSKRFFGGGEHRERPFAFQRCG